MSPEPRRSLSWWEIYGFVTVYIGMILAGFASGWGMHTVRNYTEPDFNLDFLISAVNYWWLGNFMINLTVPVLLNRISRKLALQSSAVVLIVAWTLLAAAKSRELVILARVLSGMGDGLCLAGGITYLGEISDRRVRGAVLVGLTLASSLGLLLMYAFVLLVVKSTTVCFLAVGIAALFGVLALGIPESPYHHCQNGRYALSSTILKKLRKYSTDNEILAEHDEMTNIVNEMDQKLESTSVIKLLFRFSPNRMSFALVFFATVLFILSGRDIETTDPLLLKNPTLDDVHPSLTHIILVTLGTLGTLAAVILVEGVGRRPLYLFSGGLTAVSLCALLLVNQIRCQPECDSLVWVSFVSFAIHVIGRAIGITCIPNVMLGELFPVQVKPLAIGLTMILRTGFIWADFSLVATINCDDQFIVSVGIYLLCTLLVTVIVRRFFFETKGMTLAEACR